MTFLFTGTAAICVLAIPALSLANNEAARAEQSSFPQHVTFLVSGGGPAGLLTAIELLRAGASPDEVLVVEARAPEGAPARRRGRFQHAHAERDRTVVLDEDAVEQAADLRLRLPGETFGQVEIFHGRDHNVFENSGVTKESFIYSVFGRRFNRIVRSGSLERELLREYRRLGGRIVFQTEIEVRSWRDGSVKYAVPKVKDRTFSTDYLFVAEGSHSKTMERLGIGHRPVPFGANPQFIGTDFKGRAGFGHGKGESFLFFDDHGKLAGYGFVGDEGGSIGISVAKSANIRDPDVVASYAKRLERLAAEIGIRSSALGKAYGYSGAMYQSERVHVGDGSHQGKIFFLGDSARTNDPVSANGVNTAFRDARAIGRFYRRLGAPRVAESDLIEALTANTRRALRVSRHFENWIEWAERNPGLAKVGYHMGVAKVGTATRANVVRKGFFGVSNLMPRRLTRSLASGILGGLGAPAFSERGPDPTRQIQIHPADSRPLLEPTGGGKPAASRGLAPTALGSTRAKQPASNRTGQRRSSVPRARARSSHARR